MADKIIFTIDGRTVEARLGQTIMQAADQAGIYIPRLCYREDLGQRGSCRLCTVRVNGRPQAACIQPAMPNLVVENDTKELFEYRRQIIDMLFVEGNHFCMFCEKSGNCELQAMAYRFGISAPRYDQMFPKRELDATHPDVLLDRNRCILCGRCVQASKRVDGKSVFEFVGRGPDKKIGVNSADGLSGTDLDAADRAASACPVGAIVRKREGFRVPIGKREFDHQPIGSNIEKRGGK